MALLSHFSENRASIVRLSEALGLQISQVNKLEYRVELVDPVATNRTVAQEPPLAPVHHLNPSDSGDSHRVESTAPRSVAAPQLERAPLAEREPRPPHDPSLAPPPFLDRAQLPERDLAVQPQAANVPVQPAQPDRSTHPLPRVQSDHVDRLGRFDQFEPPQGLPNDHDKGGEQLYGREQDLVQDGFEDQISFETGAYYDAPRRQVSQFDHTYQHEVGRERPVGDNDHTLGHRQPMPPSAAARSARPAAPSAAAGRRGATGPALAPSQVPPRRLAAMVGVVLAVIGVAYLALTMPFGRSSEPSTVASELASDTTAVAGPAVDTRVDEIVAVLRGLGFDNIGVEDRDGTIYLSGTVPSEAQRETALGAARALAGDQPVDQSALAVTEGSAAVPPTGQGAGDRAAAFQAELDRVIATTPIIFDVGETKLSELHIRILNTVASIMVAYPDLPVTIVGFTDDSGPDDSNRQLSRARAQAVKDYLVGHGVSDSALEVEPRGEETSSGSEALASLERRVEFEVIAPVGSPLVRSDAFLRIAIVAPSARNDLAFTQSMVDAVNIIAAERGNVEVSITDNTFVPDEAAAAIRDYAAQDYDLVIAHGSQFGGALLEIAPEFPDVAFAWGTASDTFGLPNVYAYDAASQEGGYVMGGMAGLLSSSGVIGVVGPIEVGDAELYVNGFQAGARAEASGVDVQVTYTGSFSDLTLAAEAAQAHVGAGADVMTGSAQMVVGAVSIASENGALWFGTQSNQASLAPTLVVASQ
ncbi:MAG: BMP family ABC transporter substrate-binding protein, partial [Actinomycetia bacterium]|nr:BMP family ABC transporter substrate-binding protein [Actinomycetes bacterium]